MNKTKHVVEFMFSKACKFTKNETLSRGACRTQTNV